MTYREFFHEISAHLHIPAKTANESLARMKLEVGISPDDTMCINGQPATPEQLATVKGQYTSYLRGVMGMISDGDAPAIEREISRCEGVISAKLQQN